MGLTDPAESEMLLLVLRKRAGNYRVKLGDSA
jgi:hypothetical protein